jgi:hypothetical protein
VTEEKSDPPGAVSDQNGEEQPSMMREGRRHPQPRSRDDEDESQRRGGEGEGGELSGAAGEGSQSTGNPDSAG